MLTYDPKKRYTAQQSMSHPWIKKHCHERFDREYSMKLMKNMRTFKTQYKLQEAVLMFIASQLATNKEKEMLQNTFLFLDTDGDGKLSKEELINGYERIFGTDCDAEQAVEGIMENLDIDQSGFIDYTEFLLATLDRKSLLSEDRLKIAFKMFDKVS